MHPQALCESATVGEGTSVWAFAHVLPGARIGRDCNICDHVFIENDVVVGDRVTVKCGVQLWDGLRVADDVFIGPNATFTNDKYPRSKQHQAECCRRWIERGASIGGGAMCCRASASARARWSAPAPSSRRTCRRARSCSAIPRTSSATSMRARSADERREIQPVRTGTRQSRDVSVPGSRCTRCSPPSICAAACRPVSSRQHVPFAPQRYFLVFDVPGKEVRGEHAHRAVAPVPGLRTRLADGRRRRRQCTARRCGSTARARPAHPAAVWAVQYKYSADAVLLVLASDPYDPADYIRDYDEFLSVVRT